MRNALVLFFAADPLAAHGHAPLQLAEDVRQIRRKVRMANYRHGLRFEEWWAVRVDDLMQALNEARPDVVHFSGHGGAEGLVLFDEDGGAPHRVNAAVLGELFETFRGKIRVVLLSACSSRPEAQAIADAVGCAIGNRQRISDTAAITFNASFYRALAFGHSVQAAYEQGRLALKLKRIEEGEWPEMAVREGVDPTQLIIVPGPLALRLLSRLWEGVALRWIWIVTALVALASLAGAAAMGVVIGLALALSLVPLVVTGGLLRYASSPAGRGVMRPIPAAVSALGLSLAVVIGGATLINRSALERARAQYDARDHAAAYRTFHRLAGARNAEAMGFVGIMQIAGQGTARQPAAGVAWLERASRGSDVRAMYALGISYETGAAGKNDPALAVHHYRAAQARGCAEAANKLGEMHRQGIGVDQSYDSALIWYVAAADAGSVDGMVNAGLMYELGLAGARDPAAARGWYARAAKSGSTRAMVHLGWMHENADPPDFSAAREWYGKAADAGDADGMNNLGVLHATGRGGPPDLVAAARLFHDAAGRGSIDAADNRGRLRNGPAPSATRSSDPTVPSTDSVASPS